MRVIAGEARSLPLKCPKGDGTRPTTDRVKETLFNMLMPYLPGSVFVDLFSGSGAIGIEAISRGAGHAYFAENGKEACSCILDNLQFTKFTDKATLLKMDVYSALYSIREKEVDVIFADPPYYEGHEERLLSLLAQMSYVTEYTLIVVEADLQTDFSFARELGFTITKEKTYKNNKHVFLKRA